MKSNSSYTNLASFLADHFGGYESVEVAAKEEGMTIDQWLEDFFWAINGPEREKSLEEAEAFLKVQRAEGNEPWQPMRNRFFDDCGNPISPAVPEGLRDIVLGSD